MDRRHRPLPDPPALHRWRERALTLMLSIAILAPLPALALTLARLLPQREYILVAVMLCAYLVVVAMLLGRRLPYQWRATVLVGSHLLLATCLLLDAGLISAGRVFIVADIIVAALMLSRRATLLAWSAGAAALLLSGLVFINRPAEQLADLGARLGDPNTLLANGIVTLTVAMVAAIGATSLVNSLARSLRTTEAALAERDRANAALEQRVVERTRELERAAAALRASEAKYRTLFHALPAGVLVVDAEGRYVEHNQVARDLLALDRAGAPVRHPAELVTRIVGPDGAALPHAAYPSVRAVTERLPITNLELGVVKPDSGAEPIWVSTNVMPLEQPHQGAVIIFNDITAYKRGAAELRASEARLRTILRTTQDGYLVIDLQQRFLDANQAYCALSGYSHAELLTMRISDLEAVAQPEEIEARIRRVVAEGSARFESRHRRRDGSHFDVEISVTYVPDNGGQMVCFFRDISARKLAELELRASERFIKQVTNTAPEIIYVYDLRGEYVVYVNSAGAQILGYGAEQILAMGGAALDRLIHPDDLGLVRRELGRLAAAEDDDFLLETEYRMVRADGSWGWFTARNTIFARTAEGAPLQILGLNQDVTARKQAEHALERQLSVQAAVARCSQLLIMPAPTWERQRQLLAEALLAIGAVHGAGHTSIMENVDDPELGPCAQTVALVDTARGASASHPRAPLRLPLARIPADVRAALEGGRPWGCTAAGLLRQHPLLEATGATGVYSLQSCPILVDGSWWGTLLFADAERERVWDAGELQLLQMAAGIVGTAIQRWRTEAELGTQLHYAEALARCSQTLLRPAEGAAGQRANLEAALAILRVTVDVSRLYIFQPAFSDAGEMTLNIVADSRAPGLAAYIEPTGPQILDAPAEMHEALRAGRWFGGPVPGRYPANPLFQESLDQNGVQAILMLPIFLGDSNWGILCALDCAQPRAWDGPTVQVLRTAAELLATVQQGWETTQTLREREHFIKRIAETTPDVIQVLDLPTRRSLFTNRPRGPMVAYELEPAAGPDLETLRMLVHPDERERVDGHYARIDQAADGEILELEFRARAGDGRERWVLSRSMVFARDAAGRPSQLLSISQDVTESRLIERALAASEARLRALRDALPDLLFVLRADGTFLEAYGARQHELMLPPGGFVGLPLAEVLPPEVSTPLLGAIRQVHGSGEVGRVEYSVGAAGQERRFEARIVTVFGDELLVVERDITERARATEALLRAKEAAEAADRAKSTFLAQISHEIRTPLTAIIGMASLLREARLASHEREHVTTICTAAETLLTIIGNILDFSKIEAGHMELSAQPFDPRACLGGALDLVAHEAARKGLDLRWQIDDVVPAALSGDGARIRQVLVNLLGNAVKFTERGTVIFTAGGRPLDATHFELVVSISDTGIGIAEGQLQQIFEPFVQADSATTRRAGGTGLGLAISKQIVELMGGRIAAVSRPGAGATFTIALPLAVVAAVPALPAAAAAAGPDDSADALRVLLAEDNPLSQQVLTRLLESLGYAPDVVGNGAEALAAVRRAPYDVVLMDIQMPELDGEAATRQIRALTELEQPRIIALTASALRGDRERYLAAGMDDYLSKPVQREELRDALARRAPRRPPAPSEPGAGLVDWAMVERMLASFGATPAEAAETMLGLFRATLGAQMEELGAAVAADDRPLVRLLAHKLRGGGQQLGAALLARLLSALEAAAQSGAGGLDAQYARARCVYDETLALLAERLEQQ